MRFNESSLRGLYTIEPELFEDERGWFARTYCEKEFEKIGYGRPWVQINHSFSKRKGTLRGLHFQHPPAVETKLVRCIAGAIFDVAVDIRLGSPTFLQWFGTELSGGNRKMLLLPAGFAHGFLTLSDGAEVIYHHSSFYAPDLEGGLNYLDPLLQIQWPATITHLSERDRNHPDLTENFKGIAI